MKMALEHLTDDIHCWCKPELMVPCSHCDDGCVFCGDRALTPATAADYLEGNTLIIVHRPLELTMG